MERYTRQNETKTNTSRIERKTQDELSWKI